MLRYSQIKLSVCVTIAVFLGGSLQAQNNSFCWMSSYSRGVGGVGTSCPSGTQNQSGLCYTNCESNYTGAGPVCWENCPSGYKDVGALCQKPGAITSPGYPWKVGDPAGNYSPAQQRCQAANPQGCYESGLIWYPNCRNGYESIGNNVCSPVCPSDMTDTGVDCVKNSYGRGVGSVPSCGSGMDSDAGLCYPSCASGYSGVGPKCWSQCPGDHPYQCGAACAINQAACAQAVGDMVLTTAGVALNILSMAAGGPGAGSAVKEAITASEGAMTDMLTHTTEDGASALVDKVGDFASQFGKTFMKSLGNAQKSGTTWAWRGVKALRADSLKTLNAASNEFGAGQQTSLFNLSDLTLADPTGISSMVMSFTQYGQCTVDDFTADHNDVQLAANGTATITLTAANPVTITSVTTPALTGDCSITPVVDCIGQQLQPGQTCHITATISNPQNLDAELRVYSNNYTSVPYPIHLSAPGALSAGTCASDPYTDEEANLTSVTGTWALNDNQSQKFTINSTGQINFPGYGNGTAAIASVAGRTFGLTLGGTTVFSLDLSGNHLTGPVSPGPVTVKSSGLYLTGLVGPYLVQQTTGGLDQQLQWIRQPDGTWQILVDSAQALAATGPINGSTSNNATGPITMVTPSSDVSQHFRVEPVDDETTGYYRIISVATGQYLTVANNSTASGAQIVQAAWDGGDDQQFHLSVPQYAVRRPTGKGCPIGETLFDGLCYDVPPASAMTTPGIMGKVCPADWRDDGSTCWPAWSGVVVDGQADPNGTFTARHPIVVTSCSSYSAANNQSCPAHFTNVGGIGSCSCQPQTSSKSIKSINGTTPSN